MRKSTIARWGCIFATAVAASAMAQTTEAALNVYQFNRSLGESSLPVAFVFGDPKRFCLPGDSACRPPSLPAGASQPAPVVLATTVVGGCPIEIRTGNIALQTWLKRTDRFVRAVNTIGFSFPALRPYNPDSAYFSAMIDLVAVPVDPARCKGGQVQPGARDLGYVSWGGNVAVATYDGRSQTATPLNVTTPTLHKLRLQWDARSLALHMDDCRAPLFETPVYQVRGTAPAALFPVVTPQVLLAPGPILHSWPPAPAAALTPCKSTKLSAQAVELGNGRFA